MKIPKFSNPLRRDTSASDESGALRTTPWAWRTPEGVYVGWHNDVWIYREFPLTPLTWEDNDRKLAVGSQLAKVLTELGETARDNAGGISMLATRRDIHLVTNIWDRTPTPPLGTPDGLAEYLREIFTHPVPTKALFIGVKLRSSATDAARQELTRGRDKVKALRAAATVVANSLGETVPDLTLYEADLKVVTRILDQGGTRMPTPESYNQLEAWYNHGSTTDVALFETPYWLQVDGGDRIEMSTVQSFDSPVLSAPADTWLLDATTLTSSPAHCVSIRASLEPSTVTRARARQTIRKFKAQADEEAASADLGRVEDTRAFQFAQEVEAHLADSAPPVMSNVSVIFARRQSERDDDTFIDEVRTQYGIKVKPMDHRQLAALEETLPCSNKRTSPHPQTMNIPLVAFAGLPAWSELGDPRGVYVGAVSPDRTPCFLDPAAAPAENQSPAVLIGGDPGSGKTFMAQMIGTQAAVSGSNVFFINPKGFSTLAPFAKMVGGQVVRLSATGAGEAGFFDPFRFISDPEMAAEVAAAFILEVLAQRGDNNGLTRAQEATLGAGIKAGARNGARCVGQALSYVDDTEIIGLIRATGQANATFRLGISQSPQDEFRTQGGLTLIEFDRDLDFPEKATPPSEYSTPNRISIAVMQLITRCTMESLARTRGGVLIVDEAWTFLSSSQGVGLLQRLGRLGRSQNIMPVFVTQRIDDLLRDGIDMESYLSRVFIMKLSDGKEAAAALRLCGLQPTQARIDWLATAGPQRSVGGMPERPAFAIHKDLKNRHAAISVGPVPAWAREAFTTNPEELRQLEELRNAGGEN